MIRWFDLAGKFKRWWQVSFLQENLHQSMDGIATLRFLLCLQNRKISELPRVLLHLLQRSQKHNATWGAELSHGGATPWTSLAPAEFAMIWLIWYTHKHKPALAYACALQKNRLSYILIFFWTHSVDILYTHLYTTMCTWYPNWMKVYVKAWMNWLRWITFHRNGLGLRSSVEISKNVWLPPRSLFLGV